MTLVKLFVCLEIVHAFLLSEDFLSRMPSECQTVWIKIRPDFLSAAYGSKLFPKLSVDDTSKKVKDSDSPCENGSCRIVFTFSIKLRAHLSNNVHVNI